MWWTDQTLFGTIAIDVIDDRLCRLVWGSAAAQIGNSQRGKTPGRVHLEAFSQLNAYFAGELESFTLPLNLNGTAFELRLWQELCRIKYAEVCSYRGMAERIGHPQASRAVGNACGKNPLPIIIPCHRVIRSDGGIGGFAYDIADKKKLLDLEQKYHN